MITSKQIINISEDWFKSLKGTNPNKMVDIYENPGSSDYIKILKSIEGDRKEIRFVANAITEKIYVWNSYLAIHATIISELGLGSWTDISNKPNLLWGFGNINGNIIVPFKLENSVPEFARLYVWAFSKESRLKLYHDKETKLDCIKKLASIFRYNWLWLDKYVSGLGTQIDGIRKMYFSKFGYS